MSVKLNLPSGVTIANGSNTVTVKITVDTIIQKTFSVNVNLIKVPDGFNSTLDNDAVNVTVSGDSTTVNAINNGDINATIDGTSFKEGANNAQPVINLPQGVKSVGVDPSTINVTLTKK
jgi:YbbR domain-containing protein